MKKVCIYQRVLPHYRVPFFDALYEDLKKRGVSLNVVAGFESDGCVPKTVIVDKPWVEYRKNRYISLFGKEIVLQKFSLSDAKCDGVIVEQSNRLLINYFLMVLRFLGLFKLGLWGHGKNFQSTTPNGVREKFKVFVSRIYDWWFCYTERGKSILIESGCEERRITVVKNSIDLSDFDALQAFDPDQILEFGGFSVSAGDALAVYCGGMYTEKRIDFLLAALTLVKKEITDFKVVFIGDGPDSKKVQDFYMLNQDWFFWAGAKSGVDRVPYFFHAKVFLMPGLVGLAVLDSFASGVPMITTNIDYHSPEIDYLIDGYNGLVVDDNLELYAEAVINVISNAQLHAKLHNGCVESASEYSISNMAKNYADGVVGLLSGGGK